MPRVLFRTVAVHCTGLIRMVVLRSKRSGLIRSISPSRRVTLALLRQAQAGSGCRRSTSLRRRQAVRVMVSRGFSSRISTK